MRDTVLENYKNGDLREMLMEEHFAPEGFVLSHNDFDSMRVLAYNLMKKRGEPVEQAIKGAFYMRMKHTGRFEEILQTHAELEHGEIMICILKYEGPNEVLRL